VKSPFRDLLQQLQIAQSAEEVHDAYQRALAAFDQINVQTIEATGARLACCAGCSLCCWLRVDVHAHEVFLIAHYIRTHFSAEERGELMARLKEHSEKVLPLTPFGHATQNVVCPLLVDGKCSVYAVRPMACRRQHSVDVRACEYTFANPTDLEFPSAHVKTLFQTLTQAMSEAVAVYARLGLDTTIYELGTALEEALLDEKSWEDWANHMEAFAKASVTPAG
jgi:Fe-S-cluster containining protein